MKSKGLPNGMEMCSAETTSRYEYHKLHAYKAFSGICELTVIGVFQLLKVTIIINPTNCNYLAATVTTIQIKSAC